MKYAVLLPLRCVSKSRPVRALWIEIVLVVFPITGLESRPVRALWIEIRYTGPAGQVTLRRGP